MVTGAARTHPTITVKEKPGRRAGPFPRRPPLSGGQSPIASRVTPIMRADRDGTLRTRSTTRRGVVGRSGVVARAVVGPRRVDDRGRRIDRRAADRSTPVRRRIAVPADRQPHPERQRHVSAPAWAGAAATNSSPPAATIATTMFLIMKHLLGSASFSSVPHYERPAGPAGSPTICDGRIICNRPRVNGSSRDQSASQEHRWSQQSSSRRAAPHPRVSTRPFDGGRRAFGRRCAGGRSSSISIRRTAPRAARPRRSEFGDSLDAFAAAGCRGVRHLAGQPGKSHRQVQGRARHRLRVDLRPRRDAVHAVRRDQDEEHVRQAGPRHRAQHVRDRRTRASSSANGAA